MYYLYYYYYYYYYYYCMVDYKISGVSLYNLKLNFNISKNISNYKRWIEKYYYGSQWNCIIMKDIKAISMISYLCLEF